MDPTAFVIGNSQDWSRRALSVILFACPMSGDLHFAWDYARLLVSQLKWAKHSSFSDESIAKYMGQLIDHCIDNNAIDWHDLEPALLAVAVAIRLIALMYDMGFTNLEGNTTDTVKLVEAKQIRVLDILVTAMVGAEQRAKETLQWDPGEKPPAVLEMWASSTPWYTRPFSLCFSNLIPNSAWKSLQSRILHATSFTPNPPCACGSLDHKCDMADPRALHNVLFETVLRLDRNFALYCVPVKKFTSVRVWSRFQELELANRVRMRWIIGFVRAAMMDAPDKDNLARGITAVVDSLPRFVLDARLFWRGLLGLMYQYPHRKAQLVLGLEQSQWTQWREHLATVMALPQGNGDCLDHGEIMEAEFNPESYLCD